MFQLHNVSSKLAKRLIFSMILGIPIFFLFVSSKMYCCNDVTLYVFMKRAKYSPTTQPIHCGTTTGFPAKWNLTIERKNSILMTCYFPDPVIASDWLCCEGNLLQPIKTTILIWVVSRHRLFLRRHYTRKPVVATQNIDCFLGPAKRHCIECAAF